MLITVTLQIFHARNGSLQLQNNVQIVNNVNNQCLRIIPPLYISSDGVSGLRMWPPPGSCILGWKLRPLDKFPKSRKCAVNCTSIAVNGLC